MQSASPERGPGEHDPPLQSAPPRASAEEEEEGRAALLRGCFLGRARAGGTQSRSSAAGSGRFLLAAELLLGRRGGPVRLGTRVACAEPGAAGSWALWLGSRSTEVLSLGLPAQKSALFHQSVGLPPREAWLGLQPASPQKKFFF